MLNYTDLLWTIVFCHKRQLSRYFKFNYIVGSNGLTIMINKLIFVDSEIYNDIHDFLQILSGEDCNCSVINKVHKRTGNIR